MALTITYSQWQKINQLKELDLQICSFCRRTNILNLGWLAFPRLYCLVCEEEHVLCPEICYKVALNILDCELYRPEKPVVKEVIKPNRSYDLANCYLCGKELMGAGKTGMVKNRNNPGFWGVSSEFKILCLSCLGRKFYSGLSPGKRKTYNKYLKRGYN